MNRLRATPTQVEGTRVALRVEWRSAVRLALGDSRYRTAYVLSLVVYGVLCWLAVMRLTGPAAVAHATGRLGPMLVGTVLAASAGVAALMMLSFPRLAYGEAGNARLLLTLPLAGKLRLRILLAKFFFDGLWNWVVLNALVAGLVLCPLLGGASIPWILLFGVAPVVATFLVAAAVICARVGFIERRWGPFLRVVLLTGGMAFIWLCGSIIWSDIPWGWMGLLAVAALGALLVGPWASLLGNLYAASFPGMRDTKLPGATHGEGRVSGRTLLRALAAGIARREGPTAALAYRELLSRGRHWFPLLSLLTLTGGVVAFAFLRPVLLHLGISGQQIVTAYVTTLVLLLLLDSSSSPFGGEGEHLALLLVQPLSANRLFTAKAIVTAGPAAVVAVIASVTLGLLWPLSGGDLVWVVSTSVLLGTAVALTLVAVSAWDIDLTLTIEPGLEGALGEYAPATVVRLLGAALAVVVGVAGFTLVSVVPGIGGLAVLTVLVAGLAVFGGRLAIRRLEQRS